jgi:hypothetical protein
MCYVYVPRYVPTGGQETLRDVTIYLHITYNR